MGINLKMLTLYTPATGFPDLEVKIAYGLARVGIEAGCHFALIPEKGFYIIEFRTNDLSKLEATFLTLLRRILSSDRFFDLGVKAKDKGKYSAKESVVSSLANILSTTTLPNFFNLQSVGNLNIKKDMFCGHVNIPKFGGSSGLILISSFHAGKPYERDKRISTFNQNLCSICGYLAVLGLNSFAFNVQMGAGKNRKYALVLPIPQKVMTVKDLQMLLSTQKTLHNFWLSDIQPLRTFTVGLLSKVPTISDIINDLQLHFHLTLLSKDNRGDTVVEQTAIINAIEYSKFISGSPFNSATVTKLLGSAKIKPKISSLIEITNLLEYRETSNLLKFARLYTQETSTNDFINLLYPQTAKYLLEEVAMISPDIIENPSVQAVARTLRYFIREQKYGYADDIRNARRESRDFEETITKMLREAELRRIQQDREKASGKEIKNWVYVPKTNEIQELFRLASQDFESTKLALVILAFSFPAGAEEKIKSTEELQNEKDSNG